MADDNKNLAGAGERTSILPQSGAPNAEQTEVLPTHVPQAETAQMPPVAQQEGAGAFAGTPLESVAGSSADDQAGDEAVAAGVETVESVSKRSSWGKRAAIAGAAAAILSVGFGAGIITHAAIVGDGEDYYEQGYEDGYNDQGYEDEGFGPGNGSRGSGNGQQHGPGNGQQGPGSDQRGPGNGQQGRARSREMLAALDRDLLPRVAEAPAVRMEARAVPTPQPRMRVRPSAEH